MRLFSRCFLVVLTLALLPDVGFAAPINSVAPGSLTGGGLVTFDDIPGGAPPGTNHDSIFESGGAAFAERFVGQTRTTVGGTFDQLSGSPSGPLALQVGLPGQNLTISTDPGNASSTNLLVGWGPTGSPNGNAFGEGAFAVLFDFDQSEFGLTITGFTGGGTATLQFFRRDGTLIEEIGVTGVCCSQDYAFTREGGVHDIAGVAIFNNDLGGLGFDNLIHNVPGVTETPVPGPATLLLATTAAAGLGLARWRNQLRRRRGTRPTEV